MIMIEYVMKFFGYVKTQKAIDRINMLSTENSRLKNDVDRLELRHLSKKTDDLADYRSEVSNSDLEKKIEYLKTVIARYEAKDIQ